MKKSFLEIYALAVCFLTVLCFIVTAGIALFSLVAIAKPDFTIGSSEYLRLENNDAFWNGCGVGRWCGPEDKKRERPSEPELTKQREVALANVLSIEQRDSARTLVKCLIVLLVDAIAFAFHWVVARRARASAA